MTLQEAFNIADNLVRMQQLEIDQLKEKAGNQEEEIKRLTEELKFRNGEYDFTASRVDPMLDRIANQDDEIARLKRDLVDAVQNIQAHSMIVDNAEKDAEIDRLKQENFNYSEVQVQLKWAKETNSELLSENKRLKRYELEYKKREWDEAILYNNLFKASMLVVELANALKARQTDGDTPKYTESVSRLLKKADEITYQPKDKNVGNIEH